MAVPLRYVTPNSVLTGWDFSTGAVKSVAFDTSGKSIAEVRFPTDLWTEGGVSELSLMQLEGQARASTRAIAAQLMGHGHAHAWVAGGVSATHHSCGRIDASHNQVRRAICWNDQTLAAFHTQGLARLGGPARVEELIGGPWAIRYSLSHLVKDETTLSDTDWKRTKWILPHGPLAAGYLTRRFDVISVSSAASTGIMDFRSTTWCRGMLDCLASPEHRELAWKALPRIVDMTSPVGPLAADIAAEIGLKEGHQPRIFPTLDDQAAGLVGGGAVDDGQLAIILGNSAVVNSSSNVMPTSGSLDVMRLNWGPFLWMRCYSNGAQFLDRIVGPNPDWAALEKAARGIAPGCAGTSVLPFILSEPSLGIMKPRLEWRPSEPRDAGIRFRAALESLAYLIALAVREHENGGQQIKRITVSGGIAQNNLMLEILASVLDRRLERLASNEGPALGAAVAALAGLESHLRQQQNDDEPYSVGDAVATMVRFRDAVSPVPDWKPKYQEGLQQFEVQIKEARSS